MNFLCQVLADAASVTASKVAAGIILPPLPLLIAQGSQWSFLFASRQADGTIRIHAVIDFGDGSTRNGVYKVISVLRLLINWLEVSIAPGLKRIPWSTYGVWSKNNSIPVNQTCCPYYISPLSITLTGLDQRSRHPLVARVNATENRSIVAAQAFLASLDGFKSQHQHQKW